MGQTIILCALLAGCAAFLAGCAGPARPPAPAPVPVQASPPPPAPEPPRTVGLSADALRSAFGTPAFTREDGIAQIWRYDGANCRAFFFLYDDHGIRVVRHVETLPQAADEACLNALRVSAKPS